MLALALAGCTEPLNADSAARWARRHETTLQSADLQLTRVLKALPSLPGDAFACRDLTIPGELSKDQQDAMRASLCHQSEALWNADRHDEEERLGGEWLNARIQSYGVVGAELSLAGPDGTVEWRDHRGVWSLGGPQAVSADDGVDWSGARLGWGEVTVALADVTVAEAAPRPALEWRLVRKWHDAAATARVLVLADGTPDAAFVARATSPDDAPDEE
jgi:hypothetical protein